MVLFIQYPVRFEPSGKCAVVAPGATLLDAARRAGIPLAADCNGQGDCGLCSVIVLQGQVSPLTDYEEQHLSASERHAGQRLACCARLLGPLTVLIPPEKPL